MNKVLVSCDRVMMSSETHGNICSKCDRESHRVSYTAILYSESINAYIWNTICERCYTTRKLESDDTFDRYMRDRESLEKHAVFKPSGSYLN